MALLEVAVPKHTLTVGRVPAKALVDVVSALIEGARLASRLQGWGESEIEVTSLVGGVVALEAPAMVTGETGIDCFSDVLTAALSGSRESVLADRPLLDTCARFSRACPAGLELVRSNGAALTIYPADVSVLERLRDLTPGNRAVRVAGDLRPEPSIRTATLVVSNGDTVRVRLTGPSPIGHRTVVSGFGHFGPAGRCFLVEAEHVGAEAPGDELFAEVPASHPGDFAVPSVPQDAQSGVNAFLGIWPGDETDEELLAALRAIR